MKFSTLQLALATTASVASALKIPLQQSKRADIQRRSGSFTIAKPITSTAISNVKTLAASGTDNGFNVDSVRDLVYLANITIGGNQYPVQLDTGSSDLWVKGSTTPLPDTSQTSQTYNLTYGIGWAYGHISYAPVEFAGISVSSQALMDISSVDNPALSYGAEGILGLGFTSLSTIDAIVNQTGASTGRSLLYNLFLDNPSEPNFIAFSLSRSTDPSDSTDGIFTIGEYDPKYKAVMNSEPVPTWPVNSPSRWSVLIDSIVVGQNQIAVTTSVVDAPANKAVALLDSGTSYSYAPADVCEAIYGGVEGAQYDSAAGLWVVPCSAEIDIAIQINNVVYPMDPLDVSPQSQADSNTCIGSFLPQSVSVGAGQFDWLIGDNFLRSIYSVYDFGDFDSAGHMGNPYLKLLALVDPDEASVAFHKVRGGNPATNITYNASNSTTSPVTISLSQDVARVLDRLGTYFPAMLAVIALNSVLLLALIIVVIVYLVKKRGPKLRKTRGRASPVPLNRTNSRFSGGAVSQHVYEPVSMALTEDTFVPPMPAFRGDKSGNRPKSSFSTISSLGPASPTTLTPPEDEPFTPPNPNFNHGNMQAGNRPLSAIASSSRSRSSFMPSERPSSSYVPSATSPSAPRFPPTFVTSLTEETQEIEPQEVPSSPAPPSPAGSSLGVLRTPSFSNNVKPGNKAGSYMPPPGSPEDEIFAAPAPAFISDNRPRSMA